MRIYNPGFARVPTRPFSLLSLSLGAAVFAAHTPAALANPNSSLFWRDLEAYSRAQRARFYQTESTDAKQVEETALEEACVYARACSLEVHSTDHQVGTDYHSYDEDSAASGYMYSGYSLPRRLSYVRFEEAYSYSSPDLSRTDYFHQTNVDSY